MRPGGHCSGWPNGAKAALHDPQNANKDKPSPMETLNTYRGGPDESGHFGIFGGRFVAETLMPLLLDVERAYNAARKDASFQAHSAIGRASCRERVCHNVSLCVVAGTLQKTDYIYPI